MEWRWRASRSRSMNSRGLARRLKELEGRFGPAAEPWEHEIYFIEPGTGAVVSKLVIKDGRQEWWYAPGHAPLESGGQTTVGAVEAAQMSAGVLR